MKKFTIALCLLLLVGVAVRPAHAQDMPVPANLQAAIFKKVFSLNKTLTGKGSYDVLVVYAQSGGQDEIVQAFTSAGISARATAAGDLAGQIGGAGVVYLMPGSESSAALSTQKQVLTISGVPAMAEAGKAAIGLDLEAGKPKIVVHMGQLKAQGQDVSADLLKLARVIQ